MNNFLVLSSRNWITGSALPETVKGAEKRQAHTEFYFWHVEGELYLDSQWTELFKFGGGGTWNLGLKYRGAHHEHTGDIWNGRNRCECKGEMAGGTKQLVWILQNYKQLGALLPSLSFCHLLFLPRHTFSPRMLRVNIILLY